MSKFLKILNLLLKAHFFFKIPEEKKIIIFDEQSEIYISNLFNKKEFITLKNLKSKINIYIILKLIFKLKKINSFNYFCETIKIIKPKYIFSFIDNNLIFYMLKEKFTYIKFISIQNGTRFVTGDILEKLEKGNKKYKIDFYFTFNNCYSEIMSKYIEGSYKVIGSIKTIFLISQKIIKKIHYVIFLECPIYFWNIQKKKFKSFKKNYMPWK